MEKNLFELKKRIIKLKKLKLNKFLNNNEEKIKFYISFWHK